MLLKNSILINQAIIVAFNMMIFPNLLMISLFAFVHNLDERPSSYKNLSSLFLY